MKRTKRSSHDKLSIRYPDDRNVRVHHTVSRHHDRLLEQEAVEEALWEKNQSNGVLIGYYKLDILQNIPYIRIMKVIERIAFYIGYAHGYVKIRCQLIKEKVK